MTVASWTGLGLVCLLIAQGMCAPPPSVAEGQTLYRANGCASCHGPEGHGDGPVGKTLPTPPRDLRETSGFKGGSDVAGIAATLAFGLGQDGVGMPQYLHLTEHERQSLAMFVLSKRGTR
jgi:high-affinity iron transporter